jgi:hypothetical protein
MDPLVVTKGFLDQRLVDRVRAEYVEMPGMSLTRDEVQRLFGIEPSFCEAVLDALVRTGFLGCQSNGRYGRVNEIREPPMRPAKADLKPTAPVTMSRRAS